MPVVFGVVTKDEYDRLAALGAEMVTLTIQAAEIRREMAKIRFLVDAEWNKLGQKYNIDTSSVPYILNQNMEIVIGGSHE
jgi:lipoate synthase